MIYCQPFRRSSGPGACAALLLLITAASLGKAMAAQAPEQPVTIRVGDVHDVPSADFMREPSVNPKTDDMRRAQGQAVAPAPGAREGELAVVQSAPSYRTLGEAAKAGVNPLVRPRAAPQAPTLPTGESALGWAKAHWQYGLIALGVILVGMAYVAFSSRTRKDDGVEA